MIQLEKNDSAIFLGGTVDDPAVVVGRACNAGLPTLMEEGWARGNATNGRILFL